MENDKRCQVHRLEKPAQISAVSITALASPTPPPTPTPRVITFEDCPKKSPYNWPFYKKLYVFCFALLSVMNSGIASSLPSNAVPYIMEKFEMTDDSQRSLPTGIFLLGYVVGPLIWSPLSETVGRRPVILYTFIFFFLFTLACSLAPNWSSLLFFRFVCGCMGASPQTVIGGVYADIFKDRARGRAMACFGAAASFGPIVGPIISGFASEHGWRWTFWIDLIFAGLTLVGLVFLPETFGPAILKREAAKLSKETGNVVTPPLSKQNTDLKTIFLRPLYMLVFEPIILFTSIYLAFVYALVFFYFQAYPIIFPEVYGFSIKITSLAFLPVGLGAASTALTAIYWDSKYEAALSCNETWFLPFNPEFHRLPIACIGSVTLSASLFWLGWTAKSTVHWLVPVISGLFFGYGYQSIFTSLSIYVTDAYKIYSASALAASVITRSMLGAALPVAAKPMYETIGVGWATSLVGFVSIACLPIPYVLLWKGYWIRERSRFCQMLKKDEEEEAAAASGSARSEEQGC
ncbi:MFS transporter [Aspergillus undulatus]|uniref:MFS transporter n=1 Tax=Aspergillus undulatus TaxID=1810928 RepID=UPI003CCE07F8